MNGVLYEQLAAKIQGVVTDLPEELLFLLVGIMQNNGASDATSSIKIIEAIPNRSVQAQVQDLLHFWKVNFPNLPPDSLVLALVTAAKVERDARRRQKAEIIWTGPSSRDIPFRRTDQALLQLIDNSKKHILIVSFAVYRIESIIHTLTRAARNGVRIDICLETPDASEGRMTIDTIRSLGEDLIRMSRVFIWPLEERPIAPHGRRGSLHAKVAVGDRDRLFLSSANLTDNAMNLNMEMGILIEGGSLPERVHLHFEELIRKGYLKQVLTQ